MDMKGLIMSKENKKKKHISISEYEMELETINSKMVILESQMDKLINKRDSLNSLIKELGTTDLKEKNLNLNKQVNPIMLLMKKNA